MLLLDLDGTVYVGPDVIAGVPAVVAEVTGRGTRVVYLTNNASRTAVAIAGHLRELGLVAVAEDVVTSAQAAAHVLAQELPWGAAVLVVGGEGLRAALVDVGLTPVSSADDAPAAVVQGFSPDVDWRMLAEGTHAVRAGVPWVASNDDLTIPTPRGLAPGNGALVTVIRVATGAAPRVVGKPERPLLDLALQRSGAVSALVVGDRLDTDIACAVRGGLPSLLVLTGVTDAELLTQARPGERPTYLAADLHGLLSAHPQVQPTAGTERSDRAWSCGGWRAGVRAGRLVLSGDGDPVDGLRAACAAAWDAQDQDGEAPDPEAVRALRLPRT